MGGGRIHRIAGQQQRRARTRLAQRGGGTEHILLGPAEDGGENERDRLVVEQYQCLGNGRAGEALVALIGQEHVEEAADIGVVINDQYRWRGHRHPPTVRRCIEPMIPHLSVLGMPPRGKGDTGEEMLDIGLAGGDNNAEVSP
jgi:hypothetical protein